MPGFDFFHEKGMTPVIEVQAVGGGE